MERSGDSVAPQYREMIDFDIGESTRGAVNAEMGRSGDSVVSKNRKMIDFDIDESTRGPSAQRWRDLAIPSCPKIENDRFRYRRVDACAVNAEIKRSGDSVASQHREMIDFDIDGSTRGPSAQKWRDLAIPSVPI